jgi:nucleolysin TIA-1/TIAR
MADQQYEVPPPGAGPPPQGTVGAPGTGSHLPPPPLNIPQNTNPIPTSISSPMNGGHRMTSPQSADSFGRRAAPELNKRNLYVGGLDQNVKEELLKQIFETAGHVVNVKIIPEKNVSTGMHFAS